MKSVVVTGSSTGIGWGATKVLIAKGYRVFGSVRKIEDGERLCREFGPNFSAILFDVTDAEAVRSAAICVEAELAGEPLFGLVNNAGIAVPGPLLYLPVEDFRRQFEVNLIGQLTVTQAFAPLLKAPPGMPHRSGKAAKAGRIILISSVAARNAPPFVGAYTASKAALEGFASTLRREAMAFGIDVIVVAPGAVATPIWSKAEGLDVSPYAQTPYYTALNAVKDYMIAVGRKGLPPEKLGEAIHRALTARRPKVHYTVTPDALDVIFPHLPARLVDWLYAKRLGLGR